MAVAELNGNSLTHYVYHLLDEGKLRDTIVADLMGKGHDETFARELVQETYKLRNAKRRAQGLVLILLGSLICLGSCIIGLTIASTGSLPSLLYGLTTLGIVIIFAGLVKVF